MRESRWLWVGAILAVTVACSSPEPPAEPAETGRGLGFVEEAIADADRMQVEPDTAHPGSEVSVRFPQRDLRGPGFVLERKGADGWVWEWAVHSDPDGATQNVWSAEQFRGRNVEWNAGPGFDGTGPHVVPIPEGSQPGTYRICTAPTSPALCVELDVEEATAGPSDADGGEDAAAREKWAASGIADYTLEFVGGGCEMSLAGRFHIEVVENSVGEVVRHDLGELCFSRWVLGSGDVR